MGWRGGRGRQREGENEVEGGKGGKKLLQCFALLCEFAEKKLKMLVFGFAIL
jgi:hypothetical protein